MGSLPSLTWPGSSHFQVFFLKELSLHLMNLAWDCLASLHVWPGTSGAVLLALHLLP
jgi:hypothetical protein